MTLRNLFIVGLGFALLSLTLNTQATVRITEFMAVNENGLDDEDNDEEDWIEIHNSGAVTVDLGGWYLTDSTNNLTKWMFPSFNLGPDQYLVVFASNKDRDVGEFHTNFRLSGNGEYLALVMPDGVTIASEFDPAYPIQAPDISYGLRGTVATEVILPEGAPATAYIPFDDRYEIPQPPPGPDALRPWTEQGFDDSEWLMGNTAVGYETGSGYEGFINLNVENAQDTNETVYVRVPFVVENPDAITSLFLLMRFDDGMIAYINGREVAWENSPDPSVATWNSGAPSNRSDGTASQQATYNITAFTDFLNVGTNILAIHALNNLVTSSDLLCSPEITATITGDGIETLRYFPAPTPGGPNNAGITQLGPIIENEDHIPEIPLESDNLRVTARIRPSLGNVTGATLHYRINFGEIITRPFRDDGNSGDHGAGDGIYGAIITSANYTPGDMVRWYITATDDMGGSGRLPVFVEPNRSPEYFGTIVHDPSLTNPAPVLHWFIENPGAANTDVGTKCMLFFDGVFYDNLHIDIHGQSSRGFKKKSYDIDFHPGHNFKWKEGEPRADDINLLTTYPDKAHMRNKLAYDTFTWSGSPSHWVIPVRVQQNGSFYGTSHIVENGDEDWLIRMGINHEGALYKMYSTFDSATGAEKKTRKNEANTDLQAFNAGIRLTGQAQRNYVYDNMDVAQVVNYLAANTMVGNTDCCHKNYYFYRDSGFSDEWQMWPWDVDLSYGRVWGINGQSYWHELMIPNTRLFVGSNNRVPNAIFNSPETRAMYLRRVRTLMDEFLKPAGTPQEDLIIESWVAEIGAMMKPDAQLDAAVWDSHAWGQGSGTTTAYPQTYDEAMADITDVYLPERRNQLFNRLAQNSSDIPDAQPPGTVVNFGNIDVNPSSGNQDEEYVQLVNGNAFAVDISNWTITGGIEHTFKGGTVIPANGNLFVSPHRKTWRNRASFPNGGNGLHIVGDYNGHLSARGELLELTDRQGVTVASLNTPANPSDAQTSLRISEIMYHPPTLPGDTFLDADQYEYIELVNVGSSSLDLTGIKLSEGVVFSFSSGTIGSLAAGERVLVVKNVAAFTERYGAAAASRITGTFVGNLNNDGDHIRLDDLGNEKVLEFDFNDSWYPITDGRGFSLVIKDESAEWFTWELPESWRPSGQEYGSPGAPNAPLAVVPGIIINEVLSHTDLPDKDTIELYNPHRQCRRCQWMVSDGRSWHSEKVCAASRKHHCCGRISVV